MATKKKRKQYTDEFRAEAVRVLESRGARTIGEVAQSLGVAEGLIHTWTEEVRSPTAE